METSWKTHVHGKPVTMHDKRYYTLMKLMGKERRGLGLLDNRRKGKKKVDVTYISIV